ncbi:secretin N-terminal domain-containing protein, partial [Mesorhizobium sp.]|uniref:secretin N-terminal domain-containing protein n=1 Tax=Mesorhizobium sp. TaxID=1871066 RepID=UPI003457E8F2
SLKAYPLRYGSARQITALLNEMLTGQGNGNSLDNASSQISPGSGISVSSSGSGALSALSAAPPASNGSGGGASAAAVPNSAGMRSTSSSSPAAGQDLASGSNPSGSSSSSKPTNNAALLQNVRITADVTNNAVLVYGNQESQRLV